MIVLDSLYTIAYPVLAPAHAQRIESWRAEHDVAGHALLGAHFTLVFANSAIDQGTYAAHVRAVASTRAGIRFTCRRAILLDDGAIHHVVLEPREGRHQLVELHERLHSGVLARHARTDEPFVPHVTIGKFASEAAARALCERLNGQGMCMPGEIASLTVGRLHDAQFHDVATFALAPSVDGEISSSDN